MTSGSRPAHWDIKGCVPQPCLRTRCSRSLPHGWTLGDTTMNAWRLELQWMAARLRPTGLYVSI